MPSVTLTLIRYPGSALSFQKAATASFHAVASPLTVGAALAAVPTAAASPSPAIAMTTRPNHVCGTIHVPLSNAFGIPVFPGDASIVLESPVGRSTSGQQSRPSEEGRCHFSPNGRNGWLGGDGSLGGIRGRRTWIHIGNSDSLCLAFRLQGIAAIFVGLLWVASGGSSGTTHAALKPLSAGSFVSVEDAKELLGAGATAVQDVDKESRPGSAAHSACTWGLGRG